TGALAADLLAELEALGRLPGRYFILEVSADLRERQRTLLQERLAHLLPRVHWLDRLPDTGFQGLILGNEVLDAMPVQRFRWTEQDVGVQRVGWQDVRFVWREGPAEPPLAEVVASLREETGGRWPEGYASEVNPGLAPWLRELGARLA